MWIHKHIHIYTDMCVYIYICIHNYGIYIEVHCIPSSHTHSSKSVSNPRFR